MSVRSRRRTRLIGAATLIITGMIALAGCAGTTSSSPESAAPAAAGFPVTIDSSLGQTVIDAKPERVATWGWSSQDAALALGVVPVAMPAFAYGGVDGILPWDKDAIDELGGQTPQLLSGGDNGTPNVEEFVQAKPDVILAPYSGLTQEQFDELSKIAPVVAYPDKPWATSWQDQTKIIGQALGLSDEADALIARTNDEITTLAAKYPALQGKTFVYGANNQPETFNVFRADDPRVQLLTQLGMAVAPSVEANVPASDASSYFYKVSFENLGSLSSDVLVAYFGTQDAADAFVADPLVAAMPQVKEGRFAPIVGESFVMASSAPTALSIPWMLDQYVPQLAAVAERVG
ncbi:iron complex transport system substrate-binding protein [Microbacterium testaceum]|jgi:iron complex transport system substrate-binding protein|uniref:iron-siderophore ABC transporter substrate-binding protein n=1 Tax=Microbacterium TaxID=33882 RepID=UPI00277DFE6C|nr:MULTISPECIES: iron-siderophore ABC transporter substrate-binding protein [Microbacterium]MDQ1110615.1 iron complex transport system substrate-binding protein [Microbacterium testaceum]MDQ1178117.1 iron complex transport system substrate-binding protein [Microbacterium sp. SORGH_AS_0421]MDR6098840.1 iron complex transport system substrate-binding protein [Microbacterium sp. SORGH_AS_0454]